MKIRVFCNMINSVYKVTFLTEDWSCSDIELMVQYGEPDVNLGGDVTYTYDGEQKEKAFGDRIVRVVHGSPFSMCFDSRDYDSVDEAMAVGNAWKDGVVAKIRGAVDALRQHEAVLPVEEVVNVNS